MPTSKPFNVKAFLEEWAKKEVPEYQSKALTELDFRQHEERLMAMMQSQYAVPRDLLVGPAYHSGRSAAIAQLEELAKKRGIQVVRPKMTGGIKGKSADWLCIDEAVPMHPNCRCETIPPTDSRYDLTTAHDDMLDSLALVMGMVRTPGETDNDFRTRVATMAGNGIRGTSSDLVQAVMQVNGVENVIINELESGTVLLHVCLDDERHSAAEIIDIRDAVMMRVDEVRPMGVKVEYHWDNMRDRPSHLSEEEVFIQRLKLKILERYPGEE